MRATNAPAARRATRRLFKRAKGFVGGRRKLYRTAMETVMRANVYAFRDRRARKRDFRRLWIVRINAACREQGVNYSRFMAALKAAGIETDRKILADLAVADPAGFTKLIELAKGGSSALAGAMVSTGPPQPLA